MLTEVMRHYSLARQPIDVGFFETEHHAQVLRDIRAAILSGRLIALTAVIGSGKTILWRRLRADLEQEGRVIVSRSLSVEKTKITVPLLDRGSVLRPDAREDRHHLHQVRATGARPPGSVPPHQETRGAVHR